ncbi:MAG: 50S ribosomal protein L21 [Christensenellales bacterium]|uniref:Large ribosomal subunit protein bL21 n=1 Tax=Candidatus Avichristensenella intestinipullorum TaxID=2840693 RepID=A0A9D1CHC7_9FIRM|nr:50S ribosomal protein L21 [Christensenellales bacterium]HIQ61971.1 50S ribosomal protein L21 [Candidatus Avichristensenella intestinipullorum]
MYAIIQTGGKQYRVQQGDVIFVEKLDLAQDATVDFDVLLLGREDGVTVGKPLVPGAKVNAKVLGQVKGEKIIVFKYKSKKNYRRKQGHRQPYTKLEITGITA